MRNRLLTLCVLLYPSAQRAADGEMLRDLADELAEDHGVAKEAVGLARGGLRARFQHHRHRVAQAPWGEALRQLALPLAILPAVSFTSRLFAPYTFDMMWSANGVFNILGLLVLLAGAVIQWRMVAAVGVCIIATGRTFVTFSIIDHAFTASMLTFLVMSTVGSGLLACAVYKLPRYNAQRVFASLFSLRAVPLFLVLTPLLLHQLHLIPSKGSQMREVLFDLYTSALALLPGLIAVGCLCYIRRQPARALAACIFLEVVYVGTASASLVPSPYSAVNGWTFAWVFATNAFLAALLLFIAGKTSDIAAKKSVRSVGI